jgi:hypothetical protein
MSSFFLGCVSYGKKKTEFVAQNQYGRMISIVREYYMEQEKVLFWGLKRRKKSFKAQKRNLGPID